VFRIQYSVSARIIYILQIIIISQISQTHNTSSIADSLPGLLGAVHGTSGIITYKLEYSVE